MLEVRVVHMFKDERRRPAHGVFNDALQRDDVGTAAQVLQDLDLALYLLLFDRLQSLDYAFLVVGHVDRFEDLAVFAPAEFPEIDRTNSYTQFSAFMQLGTSEFEISYTPCKN